MNEWREPQQWNYRPHPRLTVLRCGLEYVVCCIPARERERQWKSQNQSTYTTGIHENPTHEENKTVTNTHKLKRLNRIIIIIITYRYPLVPAVQGCMGLYPPRSVVLLRGEWEELPPKVRPPPVLWLGFSWATLFLRLRSSSAFFLRSSAARWASSFARSCCNSRTRCKSLDTTGRRVC